MYFIMGVLELSQNYKSIEYFCWRNMLLPNQQLMVDDELMKKWTMTLLDNSTFKGQSK